jgi:hypothetical protein
MDAVSEPPVDGDVVLLLPHATAATSADTDTIRYETRGFMQKTPTGTRIS